MPLKNPNADHYEFKKKSMWKIIDKLHADKDIKITMHTFNKIINGGY